MLVPASAIPRSGRAKPLAYERHNVTQQMLLGSHFRVEFRADSIRPPTPLCHWSNHRQAVALKLFDERRLIDQPIEMYAMQVNHGESVLARL
jgi:hypothetical protein